MRNRLYQLLDLADNANAYANDVHDLDYQSTDITDQGDAAAHVNVKNNYSYDQIGDLVKDSLEQIQHIDWTVAGKVKTITRTSGSTKPGMSFGYGADGQRAIKTVGNPLDGGYREHYIRDAQGNIMATYQYKATGSASLQLLERPIYGSKRLGSYSESQEMIGTGLLPFGYTHPMQNVKEHYELTDHLGNVAVVVTGRLLDGASSGAPKQAELVSAQGYESFGSLLPGRNYSSDAYRWGFNGAEKDDEVHGSTGTSLDFGDRIYDPRIGRWLSIDPMAKLYPEFSPYSFALNSPIQFKDAGGEGVNGGFSVANTSSQSVTLVGSGAVLVTVNPPGLFNEVGSYKETPTRLLTLAPGDRYDAVREETTTTSADGTTTTTVLFWGKVTRANGTIEKTTIFDVDAIDIQPGQSFKSSGSTDVHTEANTTGIRGDEPIPGGAELKIQSSVANAVAGKRIEDGGNGWNDAGADGPEAVPGQVVTVSDSKDSPGVLEVQAVGGPTVLFGDPPAPPKKSP